MRPVRTSVKMMAKIAKICLIYCRGQLFLLSTKAEGKGINLVAEIRAVIFYAWNPSKDVQSIYLVYR